MMSFKMTTTVSYAGICTVLFFCFLGVQGQPPMASISGPNPPVVREDVGFVQVCVNVTNADQILSEAVVLVQAQELSTGATPGEDFFPVQQTLTFSTGVMSICKSFTIVNDNVVEERREVMVVQLSSNDIGIDDARDIVDIIIEDDDRVTIGFTQSQYTVREDEMSLELCTAIESGQISPGLAPIPLGIALLSGGTVTVGEDIQVNLNSLSAFSNSTTVSCINVTIIDDDTVEANETISFQLNVIQSPDVVNFAARREATIIIEDNDFATVTLNPAQITVPEMNTTNTTLQVCVLLSGIIDITNREVIVDITTTGVTATENFDFLLLSNSVTFPSNARVNDTQCFQVLIIDDIFIEDDESFLVTISTVTPDIVGDPNSSTITITRHGDVLCPILQNPDNGEVVVTSNEVGSTANYSCNATHMLVGLESRECMDDGWAGEDPMCLRICGNLIVENGDVRTESGTYIEGDVAIYTCESGYNLNSNLNRVCQSNGQWSEPDLQCLANCGRLPNPLNGAVVLSGTLEGDMARYTCDLGLELVGDEMRECGSNKRWLGSAPICSGGTRSNSAMSILLVMAAFLLTLSMHLL